MDVSLFRGLPACYSVSVHLTLKYMWGLSLTFILSCPQVSKPKHLLPDEGDCWLQAWSSHTQGLGSCSFRKGGRDPGNQTSRAHKYEENVGRGSGGSESA